MSALEVIDITKTFIEGRETVAVLKGVSFSLESGEIVALEGPSGSGKTTLLSIIGCILTPTSGHLRIAGRPIDMTAKDGLPEVRRRCLGFVFQQFNLFPALTALENVELALNVRGLKGGLAVREADRVLEAVGLGPRRDFLPRDLSGGQKQRVAIARALAGGAPLILADEPTANLDQETGTTVLSLFRDLAKREGRSVLIVTHDPKVRAIADRVIRIDDGHVDFTKEQACPSTSLRAVSSRPLRS